ncbi:hypothetical protein UFOVP1669_3 [uncultured Caudovirales phage]|uniref:Uncharacterized protein n=2 Tax=uncultured Caudovirales phage TaxID=2100421 RepID=A0A6J5R998_9CAUD|nr:hypothetical protein UFOVP1223_10 [uncultured Caudovirales phage]CAB4222970.1 hypothetical protein UFOVP1669_3 [uncultured Caudovirales phage]
MTINTTFTVGATLTAAQQNNFPRGLAADIKKSETTDTYTGTEKAMLAITFSQVSGRNYLITFIEPNLAGTAATTATYRFREGAGVSGNIYNTFRTQIAIATNTTATFQYVLAASTSGTLTIQATATAASGTVTATRSSSQICNMFVTDLGTGYVYTT